MIALEIQPAGAPPAEEARFLAQAAAINEQLIISSLRQHELTAAAEDLNAQLRQEIAERRLAEDALREAKERLATQAGELERLVDERTEKLRETIGELEAFSYSIAHDMRAPLRSMSGFSQMLLEDYADKLDATGVDYLGRIARSSERLDRLIRDVLDYTNILRGQVPHEPVDSDRLVRDMLDTYPDWQPPIANIQIEGRLPMVLGNEAFLTQCLSNLLSNAVKFVAPGTIPSVRIRGELKAGRARIWIEDNGIGIASADQARVFRMFERLNLDADYEGTGIGLTIARKAAERMGGEVGFYSEPAKGSRFWIELKTG